MIYISELWIYVISESVTALWYRIYVIIVDDYLLVTFGTKSSIDYRQWKGRSVICAKTITGSVKRNWIFIINVNDYLLVTFRTSSDRRVGTCRIMKSHLSYHSHYGTDGKFGPEIRQIGPKWDKYVTFFRLDFSTFLLDLC